MNPVNFTTTKEEDELILKIVKRTHELHPDTFEHMDLLMDLSATHSNGTPLDFQKFIEFDDFNFNHDIFGISNNMDRNTGELVNCFLPRCSK